MDIGLSGGAYQNTVLPLTAQQSINLYPEVVEARGRTTMFLRPSGGLTSAQTSLGGPTRALISLGGFIYGVFGEDLVRWSETTPPVVLGTIPGEKRLAFAHNAQFLMFVDELFDGYVYDIPNTAFTQITDLDFPNTMDVVYLDGYFIVAEAGDSRRFFLSAVNDPLSWNALDFASKEGDPNPIRALIVNHNDLFILGDTNTEVWRNVGNNLFPFQRLDGSEAERGAIARDTPVELDNSFYFVGDDRVVYRVDGYIPRRVSNHALEAELDKLDLETIEASFAQAYTHEGHFFYCLTAGGRTWVYDATTSALAQQSLWHERRSHDVGDHLDSLQPWRVNFLVEAFGKDYAGDALEGRLGVLTDDVRTEYDLPIKAVRTLAPLFEDVDFLSYSRLELRMRNGVGTIDTPAYVEMSSSYDGGRTWTDPKLRSMGKQGDYNIRAIWRRLGRSVDRVFRFATTDPRPFAWLSAHIDGERRA